MKLGTVIDRQTGRQSKTVKKLKTTSKMLARTKIIIQFQINVAGVKWTSLFYPSSTFKSSLKNMTPGFYQNSASKVNE